MNLHEYQAKSLFQTYRIPVPAGEVVRADDQLDAALDALATDRWVIKAQIHAGARGKAGGVKLVDTRAQAKEAVQAMLGQRLATPQTAGKELPIHAVLIETTQSIEEELYLSLLVDRARKRHTFIISAAGGMDIEAVAESTPERIHKVSVDPAVGLMPYQCREVGFALNLTGEAFKQLGQIMQAAYQMALEKDMALLEINPLIKTTDNALVALDAKVSIDPNALYRQKALAEWRDPSQEDEREARAADHQLNYIALEGNIGCMVNGAGLAMATMDLIQLHGGQPANFLDVGGGATADRVAEAFKLIVSSSQVASILVNIFGGIVRCDLIAEGIIQAVKEVGLTLPVVVRLEGTNVEQGRARLAESGLQIVTADTLSAAAKQAVELAGEDQ
ncbi:ADP-forming succinate--CoA ligase subunit beta [Thiomicrospira sp. WB1]|uniref:ADP-forming succinate--CoA ligase subunit beta n=1 Tax=Thiomicrospira sp. WB1 TaxID=1685380 RepID=UPI0007466161|nr:ADP-forming succinate--CoA ligase subunit beta [Thiomicrospira sp. WB1]KUJ71948.1 succinate--CoA ligase subunit beta [Thiomicrospira sp. WB1]